MILSSSDIILSFVVWSLLQTCPNNHRKCCLTGRLFSRFRPPNCNLQEGLPACDCRGFLLNLSNSRNTTGRRLIYRKKSMKNPPVQRCFQRLIGSNGFFKLLHTFKNWRIRTNARRTQCNSIIRLTFRFRRMGQPQKNGWPRYRRIGTGA